MTTPDPKPVPRRVAYRVCADLLFAEATRLRERASGRDAARRYGHDAARDAAAKSPGRAKLADAMAADAAAMMRLCGDDAACAGPGVDAAILGYLAALVSGWADAAAELRAELSETGRSGELPAGGRAAVCRAVIGGDV